MTTSLRNYSHRMSLAVGLTAVLASGCTLQEQTTPAISGPSELGLSLSVVAQPETLPRDGSSMSEIVITAFDANGQPKPNQRNDPLGERRHAESDRSTDRSRRQGQRSLYRARRERAGLDRDHHGDPAPCSWR